MRLVLLLSFCRYRELFENVILHPKVSHHVIQQSFFINGNLSSSLVHFELEDTFHNAHDKSFALFVRNYEYGLKFDQVDNLDKSPWIGHLIPNKEDVEEDLVVLNLRYSVVILFQDNLPE